MVSCRDGSVLGLWNTIESDGGMYLGGAFDVLGVAGDEAGLVLVLVGGHGRLLIVFFVIRLGGLSFS